MKRREELADLRTKDSSALVVQLKEAEKRLLELRFSLAFRKLKTSADIHRTRKEIARLQTILREKLRGSYLEATVKER